MNYDQPRRRADGSGWHYTRTKDGQIWPIGYCRDHPPHATEDEARDCYTSYLLNERLDLDWTASAWWPCNVDGCETLTNKLAVIPETAVRLHLCDEHRTKETVAQLFGQVGDSIHS